MKSKWIIAGLLILVLITLCGASLFAVWQGVKIAQEGGFVVDIQNPAVSAEATEEKTLTVKGPVDLTVNNDFGDINIEKAADGQVHIKAEKTGWGTNEAGAQESLKNLKVVIDQSGDTIKVSVKQPNEAGLNLRPRGGSVKFTISVPAETTVKVQSSASKLTLSGTTGDADLKTEFGDIVVSDVTGSLLAESSTGNVDAKNITSQQEVTLSTEFGNLEAHNISGSDITATSTNGQINLSGVKASGLLKTEGDFGNTSITDSQAAVLDVKSTNGKVNLEKVAVDGAITVKSDFGDLVLEDVSGSTYELNTQNGLIRVDGARGSIKAHSEFGEVKVLNAQNATLDLSSVNGSLTFEGSLGQGPHKLSSEFGNISLTLPASSALNVDLQTDFGKISSDFEITVSGNLEQSHWIGKFNGGGDNLTASTNNGNINIYSR